MKKNVASQNISAQMTTISDGSDFTGTVTVTVTKDNGTQAASGGTVTHKGGGEHNYAPTQAETNADFISFNFAGTGAITAGLKVYTTFPQAGDNFARLGAPAGASVSADNAAIKADTGEIGTAGAGLTNINLPNQTMDIVGNITGNLSGSVGSVTGAVGSVAGNVDGSVASVTAGVSLAAGAVTNASLAGNMEIVFETDFATNYNTTRNAWVTNFTDILGSYTAQTGDSFALIGTGGAGLGDLGGMSTAMKAEVNAECDTALTDYDGPTSAEMEARTLVAASYFDPTADVVANVTLVATTTVCTDLTVTTFAEPGSVPAATASLKDKIGWIMAMARNKLTQTAILQSLKDDAGTGDIATATVSDDGTTFSRNKFT